MENFRAQGPLLTVATAVVFMLVSSLRFDFFIAAVALMMPMYLLHIRKFSRFTVMLILGMFLLPVITHFAENQISNREEWATYNEFNDLRGSMHGTPGLSQFVATAYEDETISKIRRFGWESEDLLLFGSWYFEDKQLFNISTLEKLKEKIDLGKTTLPLQPSLENITYGREFILLFGFLIVALGVAIPIPKLKYFILFQALWFFTISLIISSRSRFPDRFALGATVGLYVCILVSNLILLRRETSENQGTEFRNKKTEILLFTSLMFTGVFVVPHKFSAEQISLRNQAESTRLQSELQALDEIDPNGIFVYIGAQIAAEGINPWSERTLLESNRLLGLGWATNSPHQEKRKKAMDLDTNFVGQIVNDPNKYLLTSKNIAELLEYSYERRANKRVKLISLEELPYGTVFKIEEEFEETLSFQNGKPAEGQRS